MMERLDYYEGRVKVLEGEKAALEKLLMVAQSATKDATDQGPNTRQSWRRRMPSLLLQEVRKRG